MKQRQIAFVSPSAHSLVNPGIRTIFGGIETRAWTLAVALADAGQSKVSFILKDIGQPCTSDRRNIEILSYTPQYPSDTPNRVISESKADAFITFGVNQHSSEIVRSCNILNKPVILSIASDDDLSQNYYQGSRHYNTYNNVGNLCYYPLAFADAVVVQTARQMDLLNRRFQRQGILIKNPLPIAAAQTSTQESRRIQTPDRYVLWVGRSDAFHKRPLRCIDLAKRCPNVHFLMVMNKYDTAIDDQVRTVMPPNVTIIDSIPYNDIHSVFARACIFASTSSADLEGFPNVFLIAGKNSVPVVSLESDPDAIFSQAGCGFSCAGDLLAMAQKLTDLWNNPTAAAETIQNFSAYISQQHNPEVVATKLSNLIEQTITSKNRREYPRHYNFESSDILRCFYREFVKYRMLNLISQSTPVGLFPCGLHTVWLLDIMKDLAASSDFILMDDNAARLPPQLGRPVYPPDAVGQLNLQKVILSTDSPSRELTARATTLFGNRLINIYEGMPSGPYGDK